MKDIPVDSSYYCIPATSKVHHEPLGVVLVISAWNFPAWTLINPAISAIAAGNVVFMKPSEVTPHCSASLRKLVE